MNRTTEIQHRLRLVLERIDTAARDCGRDLREITLIAVTKNHPAADVLRLAELGVHAVGENRDQEASAKAAACTGAELEWHFIGQLQSNKAGSVARYASMVHSVDRTSLAVALDRAALAQGRVLDCLVQIGLDRSGMRGGVDPDQASALADRIAERPGLRLRGVMAVAPIGEPPGGAFTRLTRIAERIRADHPEADVISAGMSADLEDAIAAGTTHVRIGSAILGGRPLPVQRQAA